MIAGIIASQLDYDALVYINTYGITDPTQRLALDYVCRELKLKGLWSKITYAQPMLYSGSSTIMGNIKITPSLTVTKMGGYTEGASGWQGNGTSGYLKTGYLPSVQDTLNDQHIAYYSNTNNSLGSGTPFEVGVKGTGATSTYYSNMRIKGSTTRDKFGGNMNTSYVDATNTDARGFFIETRTSSTLVSYYKNGSLFNSSTASNTTGLPNLEYYINAFNDGGAVFATSYSNQRCAWVSFGKGLTIQQAADYYTIIQNYQTILGRQV
jgi:hypothetical protein